MKLRNKVTIILSSIWLVMVVIAYAGSQHILSKSYFELENKQAIDSMQRVHEAIEQMTSAVNTMTASWGIWDDTYKFVEDLNQTYIKTNLVLSSFTSSDIDVMLFYNKTGDLVYKMAVNPERTGEVPPPAEFLKYLAPAGHLIYKPDINKHIQGLAALPSGIIMLAAQAITTSNNEGPSHGTLIMARYLSDAAIKKIKDVTKIKLSIHPLSKIDLDTKLQSVYESIKKSEKQNVIVDLNTTDTMTGYGLLKDLNDHPIAIIQAEVPRQVYQFGVSTVRYYNTVFFIYSVILMTFLWYLLQNLLVRRLENLKSQIGTIDNNQYFNNIITGFSDEVSSVASLYHQATHDPLTGLANRNLLEQAFEQHVTRLKSGKDIIAVLFLDVDHFKHVNDSLGHEIGDLLLIDMAEKLTECLREHDLAVRMGGDEFVVMLVGIDIQQLHSVIDRIYKLFSQSININEHQLFLESSMGISIYPNDGNNMSVLLKKADIALYHAKESGRNHYQYYSEELNKTIQESYKKEADLQRAIDNKELFLVYQPIVDVMSHKIIGIEALLRWCHPQRGLLTASEIIPIAEKSGLIVPIGKWVITTASQQIKRWQERSLPVVPVTVNISLSQTKSASIYKLVNNILADTRLDPQFLELELTEISYAGLDETILNDLDQLKDIGVNLIVDDFGIGSAGLAFLRRLPVSKLKIDRSFIKDIHRDPDDCAITLAIIAIAHHLDLKVIAEGVETREQYDFLKANHVDAAQGNYFSKPVYADDCEMMLRRLELEKTD